MKVKNGGINSWAPLVNTTAALQILGSRICFSTRCCQNGGGSSNCEGEY